MAEILVTDGEQRSALATTRSLGRAGHTVYVASSAARSLAGASRYARAAAVVPDPLQSPEAFVNRVIELVDRWRIQLLLPVTESALLALLPARDRIRAALPFPTLESFLRLCDKSEVAAEARQLGIAVPRTIVLEHAADAEQLSPSELEYPLIAKPNRSVSVSGIGRAKQTARTVANRAALTSLVATLPAHAFPLLLQQRVTGPGIGIFVLLQGGELTAAFAHRRIREKPPWGGVSVYRESIPLDQNLLARSVALLQRFEFDGAAMVEYKVDERTGIPFIMEINGRFWGSLQLAIDAGVDFPTLLVRNTLQGTHSAPPCYRVGTRSRWFWGDVDNLLLHLRGSSGQNGEAPSRLRACADFMRAFGPGSRSEVFQVSDPLPAVRETIDWITALARRS